MPLFMPTRELTGLLADIYPFASKDEDDSTWHRVIIRWDGKRLFAFAGDGTRMAQMSWGADDGDQPELPLDWDPTRNVDADWELAILPGDAKEIATKFKVNATAGDLPVIVDGNVDGNTDRLSVRRTGDGGLVALTGVALARPWDDNQPDIAEKISDVADAARTAPPAKVVAFSGFSLVDFVNPKVVRQRGPVVFGIGRAGTAAYIEIGRHFRGAIIQDSGAGLDNA